MLIREESKGICVQPSGEEAYTHLFEGPTTVIPMVLSQMQQMRTHGRRRVC